MTPARPPVDAPREVADDPPPILGTWPRVYALIVIYLVLVISLLALFTRSFTP